MGGENLLDGVRFEVIGGASDRGAKGKIRSAGHRFATFQHDPFGEFAGGLNKGGVVQQI